MRLLISGMYDARTQVSWSNVAPLLQIARKYDIDDIQLNCESFLIAEQLTMSTLPRNLELSCAFSISAAIERCQVYIATADNFLNLLR